MDHYIWDGLINYKLVSNYYTEEQKLFAIKIFQKDEQYIKTKYQTITSIDLKNEYFMLASAYSNLTILIFLLEVFEINKNYIDDDGYNFFLKSCAHNNSTEIIDFFLKNFGMNIYCKNNYGNNCLHCACMYNTNITIIKYLIEDIRINVTYINNVGDNCLTTACWQNSNVEIIKYLIEDVKMNHLHTNIYGENCLIEAVFGVCSITIIKYLIEKVGIDINYKIGNDNYLDILFTRKINASIEVIKYFIENTNIQLSLKRCTFKTFKEFIPSITRNYARLNELIKIGFITYCTDDMISVLQTLNPLVIKKEFREVANIGDPFDNKYNAFCNMVSKLECEIPLREYYALNKTPIEFYKVDVDFTYPSEILFKYKNISYHGHRKIVYNSMCLLKDIQETADFEDTIIINTHEYEIPTYIVNLYINSCYTQRFDMRNIETKDIIPFIKFVDQYPTNILMISNLERPLITFFAKHKIEYDSFMKDICNRYQLKLMYLVIKLQEFS
jgi:hypothetical protein